MWFVDVGVSGCNKAIRNASIRPTGTRLGSLPIEDLLAVLGIAAQAAAPHRGTCLFELKM